MDWAVVTVDALWIFSVVLLELRRGSSGEQVQDSEVMIVYASIPYGIEVLGTRSGRSTAVRKIWG